MTFHVEAAVGPSDNYVDDPTAEDSDIVPWYAYETHRPFE